MELCEKQWQTLCLHCCSCLPGYDCLQKYCIIQKFPLAGEMKVAIFILLIPGHDVKMHF